MKNKLKDIALIVLGIYALAFTGVGVSYAAGLTIPQGGTGNTSYTQGSIPIGPGVGTSGLRFATSSAFSFATSTGTLTTTYASTTAVSATSFCLTTCITTFASGSGTVTNIATTWPLIGGPITTTGTLTFGGLSTSTPAAIGDIPYFSGVNTFANVATTSLTVTGPITFSGILGSQIGGSAGSFGCATCSTFGFPFTTTSNFGQTVNATTTALWFQATPVSLMASSTAQFTSATSTTLGVTNELNIPKGTSPVTTNSGDIAINTTAASSSIQFATSTGAIKLFDEEPVTFTYATSSPAGTTTLPFTGSNRQTVFTSGGCLSTGGTVNVRLGNYVASTTMLTSTQIASGTTVPTFTSYTGNNTFNQNQTRFIDIGTWSSTGITYLSCTFMKRYIN